VSNYRTTSTSTALSKTFTTVQTGTTTGGEVRDPTIGAAKSGSLTTRTDNNTGVLTMNTGHGITTGQRLDVYWSDGLRYGMTVGTVSVNSVPIDLGGGDNLPVLNTAITAMVPQQEEFTVTAADLQFLAVTAPDRSSIVFADASDVTVKAVEVTDANNAYQWNSQFEATNPFGSTDVASVFISRATVTGTGQVSVVALDNDA